MSKFKKRSLSFLVIATMINSNVLTTTSLALDKNIFHNLKKAIFATRGINSPQLSIYETLDDDGVKVIKADAWDNEGESGIWKVELPSGDFVYATVDNPYAINTEYYPTQTDTYTFKAYDKNGNVTEKSIQVTIDTTSQDANPPQLKIYETIGASGLKVIKVDAWDNDGESGILKVELPSGEFAYPTDDNPYVINTEYYPTQTGIYTFKAYDKSNNCTEDSIHVIISDVFPGLNVYSEGYSAETNSETVQVDAWVESGGANLSKLELPDGTFVYPEPSNPYNINYTYKATTTGLKTFKVYDVTGRVTTKSIETKVDDTEPNLVVYVGNIVRGNDLALKIDAWDKDYDSGIQRVEVSDGKTFEISNDDQYSINVEYIPTTEGNFTVKAYDKAGRVTEKTVYFKNSATLPVVETNVSKKSDNSYTLEFNSWTINNAKLSFFKLPNSSFIEAGPNISQKTISYDVDSPGEYIFTAIDEFSKARTVCVKILDDGSFETELDALRKLVEQAELNRDMESIQIAREAVNALLESLEKDILQDRLNAITNISDLEIEKKCATASLDIYIKCENLLSMSLDTNSITFSDYSGVSDMEKIGAVNITVNSSLPYSLNAYLPSEIFNSDKSEKMDLDVLKIKENSESVYKEFENTTDKIVLKDNCNEGNNALPLLI